MADRATGGPALRRLVALLRAWSGGVRVRAALAATLVVAAILAVSAVTFVLFHRRQLEATLTDVARQQAAAVATQVARGGAAVADVTPAGAGERALVQVLDDRGRIVTASPSIGGAPPLVDRRPAPGRTEVVRAERLPIGETEPFVVVARGVSTPRGNTVVLSAQSLETVERANDVLVELLG